MQTLMPTLTEVVFYFKCYVQSALTVCYGCANLYFFKSHVSVLFERVENYLILKSHDSQNLKK